MSNSHTILEIPLAKASRAQRSLPENVNDIIEQEYATRYLTSMGASPSRENRDYLLKNFPLSEALVLPIWAKGTICVVPRMTEKEAVATGLMDSLLKATVVQDDSGKKHKNRPLQTKAPPHSPSLGATRDKKTKSDKSLPNTTGTDVSGVASITGSIQSIPILDPKSKGTNLNRNENKKEKLKKTYPETQEGRRVSWCTVNTLNLFDSLLSKMGIAEILSPEFQQMMQPLNFTEEQMNKGLNRFTASIVDYTPIVKHDKTGALVDKIKRLLTFPATIRLYGLLCHFCSWNIIHPCIRRALVVAKELDPIIFDQFCLKKASLLNKKSDHISAFGVDTIPTAPSFPSSPIDSMENARFNGTAESNNIFVDSPTSQHEPLGTPTPQHSPRQFSQFPSSPQAYQNKFNSIDHVDGTDNASDAGFISISSATSLPEKDKESIFLHVEMIMSKLSKVMGYNKFALNVGNQGFVCCCHFVVDHVLTTFYPWLAGAHDESSKKKEKKRTRNQSNQSDHDTKPDFDTSNDANNYEEEGEKEENENVESSKMDPLRQLRLELRRLIHQAIADIVDPSRMFTTAYLALSAVTDYKPIRSKATRSRFFVTSVVTRAVFGDAKDHLTRKLLNSGDKTPYVTIPGVNIKSGVRASEYENVLESYMEEAEAEGETEVAYLPNSTLNFGNDEVMRELTINNKDKAFPLTSYSTNSLGRLKDQSSGGLPILPTYYKDAVRSGLDAVTHSSTPSSIIRSSSPSKKNSLVDQLKEKRNLRSRRDDFTTKRSDINDELMLRNEVKEAKHKQEELRQLKVNEYSSFIDNNALPSSQMNVNSYERSKSSRTPLDFHNLFANVPSYGRKNVETPSNHRQINRGLDGASISTTGDSDALHGRNIPINKFDVDDILRSSSSRANRYRDGNRDSSPTNVNLDTSNDPRQVNNTMKNNNVDNESKSISSSSLLVQNDRANQKISLKAKSTLNTLLIDMVAERYSEKNVLGLHGRTLGANYRADLLTRKNATSKKE